MKTVNILSKSIVCENPSSPFFYFGWPSVARLADGALAVAASGFRLEHVCPFGKAVICFSRDEGKTWTAPAVYMDTLLDDRDAGLVPFQGGRRVILTSFNNTLVFQRKWNAQRLTGDDSAVRAKGKLIEAHLDYLESLGNAEDLLGSTYRISDDGGCTYGEIKISPVTSPHGPCCLNDGSLLWVGRRFSSDDSFEEAKTPFVQAYRLNDRDEWEHVADIENIYDEHGLAFSCEPHAVQLADGKIIVHLRVQRGGEHPLFTVYQSESLDGGKTFSKPHKLLGDLGGSPAHLITHSSGKLISAYGYRNAPFGIRAMISEDAGETWDTDYVIDMDGESGDLGYPATVELKDGSLLTVYYENRGGQSRIMQKIWGL